MSKSVPSDRRHGVRMLLHGAYRGFAGGARRARERTPESHRAPPRRTRQTPSAPGALHQRGRRAPAWLGGRAAARRRHRPRHTRSFRRLKGEGLMAKKVTLLVGTKKGLYILRGDAGRGSWACEGPEFAPAEIHHAAYDPRDGSMFAAVNQTWGGSRIEVSRDMGKTWKTSRHARSGSPASAGWGFTRSRSTPRIRRR